MAEPRTGARLVAASLSATLMPLNSTMIAVALPDVAAEFDRDPALVTQALVTSYLVAAVVLQSPAGRVGDRIGHVRMVATGQVLVAAGALLGYLAGAFVLLVLARVLMAAGSAALVPSTLALMRQELPPDRRGRAFGAFGALMALSAALGPVVGGELVRALDWRSVFAANLPVLAVSLAIGAVAGRPAPRPAPTGPQRFDWVGTGLLAAGLTTIVVALRPGGDHVLLLLLVGTGLLVPFVVWERRIPDPVVAFELFRSAPFSAGVALIALQNLVMYALVFEVPLVADARFGLDARETGRLLVAMMLAMVVTSPVAGRLSDRFGARPVAVAGSAAALLGVGGLAWTDLTSAGRLALPLALVGVGLGLATPAAQSASMTAVRADLAGAAAGISSTMRYLGGVVGVAVMSLLLDTSGSRADMVAEQRTLMAVFGAALLAGGACAVLLPGRSVASGSAPRTPSVR